MFVSKEEYKEYIRHEVYGNKKLTLKQKYKLRYKNPSTNAVFLIRTMQYHAGRKGIHKYLAERANLQLVRRYNIFVGKNTKIGLGLKCAHPTGIIIGQTVIIGKNCSLFQGVTIGSRRTGDWKLGKQPHIGDNCTLFSGCAVIGDIEIGDNVIIGANAVMNKSAASGTTWVGIPAREVTHAKTELKEV
jgi:serine O-acetyltransferase